MNPKIDRYISREKAWREETASLRALLLDAGLTEELKWSKPCYSYQEKNVAIIQGFKEFCALMFFKGALLKDPKGILKRPGDNSQAARRAEFTRVEEIAARAPTLKTYIHEAIALEKAGRKVEFKKTRGPLPEELRRKLDENRALRAAFAALTPGRQRGYFLHISGAKQAKTRAARAEKCVPQILAGKGFGE